MQSIILFPYEALWLADASRSLFRHKCNAGLLGDKFKQNHVDNLKFCLAAKLISLDECDHSIFILLQKSLTQPFHVGYIEQMCNIPTKHFWLHDVVCPCVRNFMVKVKRALKVWNNYFDISTSTAKFLWAAQTMKGAACKLMKLHASLWNCMQAHGTSCKLMELHVRSGNCMQAHGSACKLM